MFRWILNTPLVTIINFSVQSILHWENLFVFGQISEATFEGSSTILVFMKIIELSKHYFYSFMFKIKFQDHLKLAF